MSDKKYLFTSESVTEGHPDKVCDQISDAILDACLRDDPRSRVACESLAKTGMVVIAGEITTSTYVDMPGVVRNTVKDIGNNDSSMGFDYNTCAVLTAIEKQSQDISQGVDGTGLYHEQGAGDQGMMFGYAVNETATFMPMSIDLANRMARELSAVRKSGELKFLRPDGKTQVTVEYDGNKIKRVDTVVISSQHSPDVTHQEITNSLIEKVAKRVVPAELIDSKTKFFINPTGRFVIGGPQGDCGLTGRKIIVDTYGGHGAHGGGAFSGKDPTKVDRSAAYMARYVAKNIVAAGYADKCLVQLAYAIGVADPVSVNVNCYGTEKCDVEKLVSGVREIFPLKPQGIIKHLDLLKPKYRETAAYGHFGREEPGFTWEAKDKVNDLKTYLK